MLMAFTEIDEGFFIKIGVTIMLDSVAVFLLLEPFFSFRFFLPFFLEEEVFFLSPDLVFPGWLFFLLFLFFFELEDFSNSLIDPKASFLEVEDDVADIDVVRFAKCFAFCSFFLFRKY